MAEMQPAQSCDECGRDREDLLEEGQDLEWYEGRWLCPDCIEEEEEEEEEAD